MEERCRGGLARIFGDTVWEVKNVGIYLFSDGDATEPYVGFNEAGLAQRASLRKVWAGEDGNLLYQTSGPKARFGDAPIPGEVSPPLGRPAIGQENLLSSPPASVKSFVRPRAKLVRACRCLSVQHLSTRMHPVRYTI